MLGDMAAWYKEWFGEDYLELYAHRDRDEAERHIDFVEKAFAGSKPRSVLDLACGSGIYTRPLARRLGAGRVVGLDISRPMLSYARDRSRAEGLANVDLVRGSALELPFGAATFEVVNCCGALHLLPDVGRALTETSNTPSVPLTNPTGSRIWSPAVTSRGTFGSR